MTRQKKEVIKKIDDLEQWIEVDVELGCGFAPVGAYDETYREIDRLRGGTGPAPALRQRGGYALRHEGLREQRMPLVN